jgi:DNA-binding CsgD family transcriptional regulator/tetratricopeptide (TPR) repeat protein
MPISTIIASMATLRTATHGADGGPIFGRERELARLERLVDGLPERGSALLVRGEAGIGKSTLLAAASGRADAAGMQVLRTTGVQSEARLPFAGLHQLVMPVLGHAEGLPAPQRTALLAAFGMVEAEVTDRFLVALALLELLSDVAEQTPVLVVAEDAHWLDHSTANVLGFVARRVEHEPIVILAASREGEESPINDAGLPTLRLGGIDDESAGGLLDAHHRQLAPAVREQLLEQARGNPLALVELPMLLGTHERGGRSRLPSPLPLTERLEQAFAAQVARLPAHTRVLLLLAAVDDRGVLGEIAAAARAIDGTEPSVEGFVPAIDAGFVEVDGARIAFRHPLVRSAVYQAANLLERNAAHSALAGVLAGQPDRQVWHRAAALVGPDESVAAALEAAAGRARRRGAISVAIDTLGRAVELSEDRARNGRRLLDAAELAFERGQRGLVKRLVAEAKRLELGTAERHRMTLIRAMFDFSVPAVVASLRDMLEIAVEAARGGDAETAVSLVTQAAQRCHWSTPREGVRELVIDTAARLRIGDESPELMVILALADPVRCGARILDVLSRLPPDGDGDADAARLLGLTASLLGDFEVAVPLLTAAVDGLRTQGRFTWVSRALTLRSWSYAHLGRWDLAAADAEEAVRLTEETAQQAVASRARAVKAMIAGVHGDSDEAEVLAAEVERVMLPEGMSAVLMDVQLARGLTALGIGRYVEAYEHLMRLFEHGDPAWHEMKRCWAIGDLAEAARYSEHLEEARALLPEMEAILSETRPPRLRVALEYARPLLAEDEEAEDLFRAALDADLAAWPFARARLELSFGTWLRRQRRVAESRVPLRAARDAFDALGALPWSERARHELRGAGVTSRPRKRGAMDELTPQELQIARMAGSGLSNREIGQQLYMSHRTVGAHLYHIFPKLGVTSRGQLRDALDPTLP